MREKLCIFFLLVVLSIEAGMWIAIATNKTAPQEQAWPSVDSDKPVLTEAQQEELEEHGRVGIDRGDGRIWIITEES